MMTRPLRFATPESRGRRGQSLVEFAMSAVIVLLLLFGVVEVSRIMLVYTTVADAARIGARYAITHGTTPNDTATNADVSSMQSSVQTAVKSFLGPGTVNVNAPGLTITTAFPSVACSGSASTSTCTGTTPGNLVQVTVSYPYDLLIPYLPISVTIGSTSAGVITW